MLTHHHIKCDSCVEKYSMYASQVVLHLVFKQRNTAVAKLSYVSLFEGGWRRGAGTGTGMAVLLRGRARAVWVLMSDSIILYLNDLGDFQ